MVNLNPEVRFMEKVKLLDKGVIELPIKVRKKFRLEKGMEFDLFFDSETIYLKRIFKSIKDKTFKEVSRPFREMAKKEKLKAEDVAEEIKKYRKKG
jgi:bifunctional DNA-binding transcriptional regulator/antitoxin component of YhaV-PrlF toxin-antitoxin module